MSINQQNGYDMSQHILILFHHIKKKVLIL